MGLSQFPYWKLKSPDALKDGKNNNLGVVESAFRSEAGPAMRFSAMEEHAGRPKEAQGFRKLLSDVLAGLRPQVLTADQQIVIQAAVGAQSFEVVITVAEAFRNWRVSAIDYVILLAKPCRARVEARSEGLFKELRRYRLVSDDAALAKQLNSQRRVRSGLTENLRSYYHVGRTQVSITPMLAVVSHETGSALWVRTTLLELWWSLGHVKNLGVRQFLDLSAAVERAL